LWLANAASCARIIEQAAAAGCSPKRVGMMQNTAGKRLAIEHAELGGRQRHTACFPAGRQADLHAAQLWFARCRAHRCALTSVQRSALLCGPRCICFSIQVTVTGNKASDKTYFRHVNGRPGSWSIETFNQLQQVGGWRVPVGACVLPGTDGRPCESSGHEACLEQHARHSPGCAGANTSKPGTPPSAALTLSAPSNTAPPRAAHPRAHH
jgi:hypothetical protein